MIILGVDPGTTRTGYGVIQKRASSYVYVSSGVVQFQAADSLPEKLASIYDALKAVIKKYTPAQVAIETAFYSKNVQSTLKIGYARGVALLAAEQQHLEIFEYAPREIKKSLTGNGAAKKEQVQYMVQTILAQKSRKFILDESDALAIALCHAFRTVTLPTGTGSWKDFVKNNPGRVKG